MASTTKPLVQALIERRRALDMTQREVDTAMGVSQCMIAKWESEKRFPTTTSLIKWAAALGMKVQLVTTSKKL